MHNYKTFWIDRLQSDPVYSNTRFKQYGTKYPPFEIDKEIIDIVDLEEFLLVESNRLPFFVGTQYGIVPRLESIPGLHEQPRIIAILGKSMLSGHVAGLTIILLNKVGSEKLAYFTNMPLK